MSSRAWDVYGFEYCDWRKTTRRVHLDTVFYDDNCDEAWVLDGLINHDGYPSNIEIETEGYKECPTCDVKSFEDQWREINGGDYDRSPNCIVVCPSCQKDIAEDMQPA